MTPNLNYWEKSREEKMQKTTMFKNNSRKEVLNEERIVGFDLNKSKLVVDSYGQVTYNPKSETRKKLKELESVYDKTEEQNMLEKELRIMLEKEKKRFIERKIINKYLYPELDAVVLEGLDKNSLVNSFNEENLFEEEDLIEIGRAIIEYCIKNNIIVVRLSKWEATSQICSNCFRRNKKLGKERKWRCSCCGIYHDRDINAARVIKRRGIDYLVKKKEMIVKRLF